MKCTYKFKNHDIGTAINVLCGKNYVQEAIREQYDNNSETIDFEFQSDPGESEIWGHISVSKSKIERVRAYDPDDWNPYPQLTPPRSGLYFIYRTYEFENKITVDRYEEGKYGGRWSETAVKSILAFKECHLGKPEFLP